MARPLDATQKENDEYRISKEERKTKRHKTAVIGEQPVGGEAKRNA